ncbi:FtsX-like permease family protein [Actinomyces israelii]|uniref:FtsX-like permease family protein n=1 Tax=Actinomyces israelii TaxID=1659 RepID=UPI00255573A7|nr:FtsX-like permease family protein [Actinomyces israelii]WKR23127.1 hypothetical protein AIF0345_3099 [Actinomyces israelii]
MLVRLAAVAGLVALIVANRRTIRAAGAGSDDAANAAVFAALGMVVLVCLLTPWLVPWMQRAVAALPVPGTVWRVAARTAALESSHSSTTVLPFLVAIGLVVVLFGARSLGLTGMRLSGFLVMFGLALLVAWSGGVAVIAMSAGHRRRDAALLRAAGAREGAVLAAQVLEGVIHALTAVLLGALILVAVGPIMSEGSGLGTAVILAHAPWSELGAVAVLTLVTTCLAVVVSSRARRGQGIGQALRAWD